MMNNTMKELIDVLQNNPNHAYDFIAMNFHKMSKDELASVTKELLYAIHHFNYAEEKTILESVGVELEESYY